MSGDGGTYGCHDYNQYAYCFSKHSHNDLAIIHHNIKIAVRLKILVQLPVDTVIAFFNDFDDAVSAVVVGCFRLENFWIVAIPGVPYLVVDCHVIVTGECKALVQRVLAVYNNVCLCHIRVIHQTTLD